MAIDFTQVNDDTIKQEAQMPEKQELASKISKKVADGERDILKPIWNRNMR